MLLSPTPALESPTHTLLRSKIWGLRTTTLANIFEFIVRIPGDFEFTLRASIVSSLLTFCPVLFDCPDPVFRLEWVYPHQERIFRVRFCKQSILLYCKKTIILPPGEPQKHFYKFYKEGRNSNVSTATEFHWNLLENVMVALQYISKVKSLCGQNVVVKQSPPAM